MKRIFLLLLLMCSNAFGAITDLKFGTAQAFDVQWSVSGGAGCDYGNLAPCTSLSASNFIAPYASTGPYAWGHPTLTSGQYYGFFNSTTNPGLYGMAVYNANGSLAYVVHDYGTISKLGPTGLFYQGGNDLPNEAGGYGTVITTSTGFSYGSSTTLTLSSGTPTSSDLTSYTPPSSSVLAAGQTATTQTATPTVQSTVVTYTTRNVVSGNTTTVYRTPVTTETMSDGTTRVTNGTESLYQTRVASNVVTTKITNGVLTTIKTPISTVTTSGVVTIESNGSPTTTTQNVLQGLNYKVYHFDAYTYTCFGFLGCSKNLLGPYRVPDLTPNHYSQVSSGVTNSGIYVPTNGSFPGIQTGTLVSYTGTITAPVTNSHLIGSVYRLYFYSNSDDGFVMKINGSTIINDQSTYQFQSVFGYTSSGWMDVVAGQTYNLEAWYWNDTGGYGMRFQWDYGAGRTGVPNSAFSTGWITETNTIDTTGLAYSNSSVVDISGTSVAIGPMIEGGTIDMQNSTGTETITSGSSSTAGATNDQQTRYNTWNNGTQSVNNYLYIEQISGDNNTVDVTQSGTKNTMNLGINGSSNTITAEQTGVNYFNGLVQGSSNTVTSSQTNTSGTNYQETKIMSGSNNNISVTQKDNGNNLMFNTITGSNNTITAVQEGGGNHYLENKLTGNGNTVLATQSGNTANKANIDLTNSGGPATVDIQQSGGKSFTIIQGCANPAGCTTVVRQ